MFLPIVLLIVAESPEIVLQCLALTVCLPISLWMEGCRERMISTTQVSTYPGPELACNLGAAICNYVVCYTALANNMSKEELG